MSKLGNFFSGVGKAFGGDTIGSAVNILKHGSTPPPKGTQELLKAYSKMPWLRGVVNKVSDSVAGIKWKVLVATGKRSDGTDKFIRNIKAQRADFVSRKKIITTLIKEHKLVEIEDHPLLDVLSDGNDFLTGLQIAKTNQSHIDLVGESFLLKERNGLGKTMMLWPLPPHWIKSIPMPGNEFFELSFGGATSETIPMSEIIWIKEPDPFNPYGRGTGIAGALADELDSDEYAAKHIKDFFYNSARPDLIVTADGLDRKDTARLEEDWNRRNQGFFKRFKTHFLNKKVEIQELGTSFKSMQMVDLRKFERDTIMQVFGVPPEIMGIIESSNRATIESADFIYSRWVLVPRLELQRSVYQERLVPEFDERIILDYESPVEEDKKHILDTIKAATYAFSVDEIRDHVEFDEKENDGGKVHMSPFNLQERRFDGSDSDDSDNTPGDTDVVSDVVVDNDTDGNDSSKTNINTSRINTGETNKIKTIHKIDPYIEHVQDKNVYKVLEEFEVGAIIDEVDGRFIMASFGQVLEDIVAEFGQDVINQSGLEAEFDLLNPRIDDFINNESFERIERMVDKTTKDSLRVQLLAGIKNNETGGQLSERVNSVFETASKSRAKTIARTESVRASNFATNEGMKQAGVENKMWLSTRDINVRDSHQVGFGLDGVTIPIRANFTSPETGASGPHPGALGLAEEDINCRCQILAVFDTKMILTEGSKSAAWKTFEADRMPFEERAKAALRKGFNEQEKAVLAKLIELS